MNHQNQKKKFHFDLIAINNLILNNLPIFFNYFSVNLENDNKKYFGCCPIHDNSDNPQALILYKNTGIWFCNTHHCEHTFQKSCIGFIRGLLSSQNGWQSQLDTSKIATITDTVNFVQKILNKSDIDIIKNQTNDIAIYEKRNFIRQSTLLKKHKIFYTLEEYKKHTEIPSQYFIKRGFSPEILNTYYIGTFKQENHQFYNRTVVPLLDHSGQYILGLTARISHPLCLICGFHHPLNHQCLDQTTKNISKWEHSGGFDKRNYLFNYWSSQECINKNGKIIIVEGPMDAIRLTEAEICYSVAIMGSNISQQQAAFIKRCNIHTVIIATDNDEGGNIARESIIKNLGDKYNYVNKDIPKNDIGELSIQEIKELFNDLK